MCIQSLNAQNYYDHYQDGLVVFQIKLDAKRILSTKQQVDFKNHSLFSDFLSAYSIEEVKQLHPDLDDELLNRVYQIKLSDMSQVNHVIKQLNTHPIIEYAELKELHHKFWVPNDTYYSIQNQYGLFNIQAEQAWDISLGNANVIVAVTDDAIATDHPDLVNVLVNPYNAVDQNTNPNPCGSNDGLHGSHVSGTVGCETNNGKGLASIGNGISVMPIKIGDCTGALTSGYEGIAFAANNGADIINMSWGGPGSGNYGQNIINNAWNKGAILVAAAGNDDVTTKFYPAGYNNVVTVASTDKQDKKSDFSNYGNWIDVSAPGSAIFSTNNGDSYVALGGTSMASPLVSGLLGLMKSYAPSATNTELISCLYSSADDISAQNPSYNGQLGNGRINAFAALTCLTALNVQFDASIESISSPKGNLCSSSFVPELLLKNNGSSTLTSAIITYNWGGSPQVYNWSGSLPSGQTVTVALPNQTATSGNHLFTATVSMPNGQTDQNTSNDNATSNFSISNTGEEVTLYLDTDCWGSDITWEIKDLNNNVVANGGPYADVVGGTTNTYSLCLSNECYTFSIYDEYGDGMNGTMYQGCSTDGSYEMKDGSGNTLFQMTAPEGNFGSSADHPFCLVTNVTDDAGITNIISPKGTLCTAAVEPVVRLQNYGTDPLTTVTIKYQTSGTVQTYAWTGNLATNQSEVVTLPAVTTANGPQVLTVYTSNPNGNSDGNPANDQSQGQVNIQNTAASLPFTEDFETDVFNNGEWSIVNPDNSTTWENVTVGGSTSGNKAAKIDFYNYQQSGRRDGMVSPKIDLTGVSSAQMTFDHAYRRFNQNAADSLIIYVSTNCGTDWNRVFAKAENGSGSFATQSTSSVEFTPTSAADWCFAGGIGADCFSINLDAYVGNNVFVKFESYNSGPIGNNLFIDNINIDGSAVPNPPVPNITLSQNQVCEDGTVSFTDQSSNSPTSWSWVFPGGTPATSTVQNPVVTYANSGNYDVSLTVSNQHGSQTANYTNRITVNSSPIVNITASELTVCSGQSISLSASGASAYTWGNGLGSGSTLLVSPISTTYYEVTGHVGNCSGTANVEVTVVPATDVTLTASQEEVCSGTSVSLIADGGNSYSWGNGLGTGNSKNVTPLSTTTYSVTGTNGNCSDDASVTIVVKNKPVIQSYTNKDTICKGDNTSLYVSGAGNYVWSPGSSLNLTSGASVIASPIVSTTYSVIASNNCGITSDSVRIVVLPTNQGPVINRSGNVLSVSLQSGETAQWFFNGAIAGSGGSLSMAQDGNYKVVISNPNGCKASSNGNYVLQTSGLSQNELNEYLNLYPNPTENTVHISWAGAEAIESILVYDAVGREVLQYGAVNLKEAIIDLSLFDTGVYLVRIKTGDNTLGRKVTKR